MIDLITNIVFGLVLVSAVAGVGVAAYMVLARRHEVYRERHQEYLRKQTAAGPWREEVPDKEGHYLAELQGNPGTFEVLEYHDGRWLTKYSVIKNPSEVVLRYAEVHDPEVTP